MKPFLCLLAAAGIVISLACGGSGGPTLTECADHPSCVKEDLLECMCDSSGALHKAEGFCPVTFSPPCPAADVCLPKTDEDCLTHDEVREETGVIPG